MHTKMPHAAQERLGLRLWYSACWD